MCHIINTGRYYYTYKTIVTECKHNVQINFIRVCNLCPVLRSYVILFDFYRSRSPSKDDGNAL